MLFTCLLLIFFAFTSTRSFCQWLVFPLGDASPIYLCCSSIYHTWTFLFESVLIPIANILISAWFFTGDRGSWPIWYEFSFLSSSINKDFGFGSHFSLGSTSLHAIHLSSLFSLIYSAHHWLAAERARWQHPLLMEDMSMWHLRI